MSLAHRVTELMEKVVGLGQGEVDSKYNGTQHIHDVAKYTMLGNDVMMSIEGRKADTKFDDGFGLGYNPDIGVTLETVWDQGGLMNYPDGVETVYFTSTSDDDSITGTGAQLLLVLLLDDEQGYVEAIVPMNGQAGTAIDLYRVMRIYVIQNGTSGTTAGTIYAGNGTITAGVPANIYQVVENGVNATRSCIYTIPKGFSGYVKSLSFNTGQGKEVEFSFVFRFPGGDWITIYETIVYQSGQTLHTVPMPFLTELSDVEIRARALSSGGGVVGSATFWLQIVDDSVLLEEV